MELIRVSAKSEPKSVAGAIAAILRNGEVAEVVSIGAAAVNQVVKSIAVARGYLSSNGIELVSYPTFQQLEVDGQDRTAIKFTVEKR